LSAFINRKCEKAKFLCDIRGRGRGDFRGGRGEYRGGRGEYKGGRNEHREKGDGGENVERGEG
jgi:hypothetical protein